MPSPRFGVLGLKVSAINLRDALDTIKVWIDTKDRQYVCVTGVHGVMESQRDPVLLGIHNRAGMVTPDGMPLVFLGRRKGYRSMDRVYGPDLMAAVSERSVREGWSHYYYGGGPGVADLLRERLTARYPGLRVVGTHCPPFRPLSSVEEHDVVQRIDDSGADLVWVGLSTPKQERFMAAFRNRLSAPVLLGVGAAFDFHTGLKSQAPRWMQRAALEWLFRLITEPRRLGKRYLVNNPLFLLYLLLGGLRLRHPPAPQPLDVTKLERKSANQRT